MGTITKRKRRDGTFGYTVQIRCKQGGIVVHTEAQTFDRRQAADQWNAKRTAELRDPTELGKAMGQHQDPPFRDAIDKYLKDTRKDVGKTKAQVLRTVKADDIGALSCSQVNSPAILAFLNRLTGQPQTKQNYLSHIGSVIRVAKPAWGYPLAVEELDAARVVAEHLGIVSRSKQRDRRPTLEELGQLLEHFGATRSNRVDAIPMQQIVVYALFSTRRQEEITRQVFEDLDEARSEIWVRDMKHPGEKIGNDVRTLLVPEALAIIQARRGDDPERTGRIFPHNASSISAAFTDACKLLGIDDLVFHDLRHEGISRLFEMGWTIPQVAMVSGHRSWTSLKRYTHMRQNGDKYAGWPWLDRLGLTIKQPEPAK
jgi:integrase